MIIDQLINGFFPNEVKNHMHICDNLMVTFRIRVLCLGFSNNYYVESLYTFRKYFYYKVKFDIIIKQYIFIQKKRFENTICK